MDPQTTRLEEGNNSRDRYESFDSKFRKTAR